MCGVPADESTNESIKELCHDCVVAVLVYQGYSVERDVHDTMGGLLVM